MTAGSILSCRSLLAGDLECPPQEQMLNRLQAGSYISNQAILVTIPRWQNFPGIPK